MKIIEFIKPSSINLDLKSTTKDEVLEELVSLLGLEEKKQQMLLKMLKKRENLGSTGIGKGIAIPHWRSLVISKLMIAVGKSDKGIPFDAIDKEPVYLFFLIVAPTQEISNLYFPTLVKMAQILNDVKNRKALLKAADSKEFLDLLEKIESKEV